jgi:hypothetical protein
MCHCSSTDARLSNTIRLCVFWALLRKKNGHKNPDIPDSGAVPSKRQLGCLTPLLEGAYHYLGRDLAACQECQTHLPALWPNFPGHLA